MAATPSPLRGESPIFEEVTPRTVSSTPRLDSSTPRLETNYGAILHDHETSEDEESRALLLGDHEGRGHGGQHGGHGDETELLELCRVEDYGKRDGCVEWGGRSFTVFVVVMTFVISVGLVNVMKVRREE